MKYILIIIGTIVVLRWVFRVLFRIALFKLAKDMGRQQPGFSGGKFGPFAYSTFNGGGQQPRYDDQQAEDLSSKQRKSKDGGTTTEGDYIPFKEIK